MSLLHRNLLAAALLKIEPIVLETLEAAAAATGPAAPLVDLALQVGDAAFKASQAPSPADQVAAAIAAQTAPTSQAALGKPPAPPLVNLAGDKSQAALAAVDALAMQLSQLATQLAAIRSNLVPSS